MQSFPPSSAPCWVCIVNPSKDCHLRAFPEDFSACKMASLSLHTFPAPWIQIRKEVEGNKDQTQKSTFSHLTNSSWCYVAVCWGAAGWNTVTVLTWSLGSLCSLYCVCIMALPLASGGCTLRGFRKLTSVNDLLTTMQNIPENGGSWWTPEFCDVMTHRLPSLVPWWGSQLRDLVACLSSTIS